VTVFVNGTAYTGQRLADGSYTVTATAADAYGNVSAVGTAPKTLVIDTAAPTGNFTIAGAKTIGGQLATNASTSTLQLSFSGGAAALYQMAFSTDGGATFSTPVAYATSASLKVPTTNAIYSVVVRVTDLAGNSFSVTQTVRLDTIGPTISSTITSGSSAYDLGTTPTFTYSASDLDGVATISSTLDSTTALSSGGTINLYTLTAGAHTILVTSTDQLGNVSTATVSFQVHATIGGLVNAVNYGASVGKISSSTKTTLLATLASAQTALTAGNNAGAKTLLSQFATQVTNAGSNINAAYASLLLSWEQDLFGRL
jgi:hypothetical protein